MGLSNIYKIHRPQYGDRQGGEGEQGKGGINRDRKRLYLGNGHVMQCADGVLLNCTLETCLIS